MEVKKGYKQTEVGVIPEDWEVDILGKNVLKVGSGITPTGGERVYKEEGRPFLRSQNVGWGNLILDDIAYIDEETHCSFNSTEIKENDVFLNITGASIGRSAVADKRVEFGNVNQHVCIIRPIGEKLHPQYLNYFLLSSKGQKQIESFQAGGNRQGLNFGQIKSFIIPLPPTKEEQTAIAATLSDADALIISMEKLIAKKRAIKEGAMQGLLTGKKRLPGFSGKWEVMRLGDVADITKLAGFEYTNYFNSYNEGGDIIVVRGTNITNNDLDLSDVRTIPRSTSNKLPRSKLHKDDLVFAYVGTIGPVYLIEEDDKYHLGPNTCKISVKDNMNPRFAFCYFISRLIKKEIIEFTSVGAQPSLSMSKIRNFKIILPATKAEQAAIAQILSDMDAEIETLDAKLLKYRMIKQGMMQELLTGKTRLV